ncbi:hypothetical protein ACOACO_02870 [Nocardioides sp. CPCC 205120]|uniref:hypothetical protein n=1 Tax=Nocardioides sp. CPCC 205120 TaxID=3406462 RepID=UPI003B5018FA
MRMTQVLASPQLNGLAIDAMVARLLDDSQWSTVGLRRSAGAAVAVNPNTDKGRAVELVTSGAAFGGDVIWQRPDLDPATVVRLLQCEDEEGGSEWTEHSASVLLRLLERDRRQAFEIIAARNSDIGWYPGFLAALVGGCDNPELEALLLPAWITSAGLDYGLEEDLDVEDFVPAVLIMRRNAGVARAGLAVPRARQGFAQAGFEFDDSGRLVSSPQGVRLIDEPRRQAPHGHHVPDDGHEEVDGLARAISERCVDAASARAAIDGLPFDRLSW